MPKHSHSSASADKARAHCSPGLLDIGFVFSAPGTRETDQLVPAAGTTGVHLDLALFRHLMPALPAAFPSANRYDYRITNAHQTPLSHAQGHGRTEADDSEIRTRTNADRVRDEFAGCRLVLLCGAKAQVLKNELSGFALVAVGHVSMTGLNRRWPVFECVRSIPRGIRKPANSGRRHVSPFGRLTSKDRFAC